LRECDFAPVIGWGSQLALRRAVNERKAQRRIGECGRQAEAGRAAAGDDEIENLFGHAGEHSPRRASALDPAQICRRLG